MRSPVRSWRSALELTLRLAAAAAVLLSLWLAARPVPDVTISAVAAVDGLPDLLRAWSRLPGPDSVHLQADTVPDDAHRDWLVALRRAGSAVSWSGDIAPIAVSVVPVNAPAGGVRVLVAGTAGTIVEVRDRAGPIDSLALSARGGSVSVPAVADPVTASAGGTRARTGMIDSLESGAVLVIGTAGWEARYVISALEEQGWAVDARLTVGPGLVVRRGSPGPIDTARYAAVIALDSAAAADGRAIAAFVRNGGGAVLAGAAAALPGVREIAPGRVGARLRPVALTFVADSPRRALALLPVVRLRDDAVVLDRRDGGTAVAARRAGAGRVVQVGYDESWRWRMQGGANGATAHREWWSGLVASASRERLTGTRSAGSGVAGAAPRAALVAALGQPSALTTGRAADATLRGGPHPWLLLFALSCLLAEWTSRRLRGAP